MGKLFTWMVTIMVCGWQCRHPGNRKEMRLPDGSVVILTKNSSLRLSAGFGHTDREAWLDGEALFELTADAGKPFLLHTRLMRIEVLGTRFHVDAYANKPGEEVDLLEGHLRVSKSYTSKTDNEPEVLQAGEMVMINSDIDLMEKEKMDGSEMRNWNAGK